MIRNCNDGTSRTPYLRMDINYGGCNDLPDFSSGPKGNDQEKHEAIKKASYQGIQDGHPDLCEALGLSLTAHARVNKVGDLAKLVPDWKKGKYDCATLHVGWGMESDKEIDTMLADIIDTSEKNDFPIYLETHRATITQDMYRTVSFIKRFPEIRFNGDFSHWYTGQEMVYGGIVNKWNFIAPVFERVRYIHGRIGNPGSIQVDIGNGKGQPYVDHFREMWTRCFQGFLKSAGPGDFICFAPELLQPDIYYARTFRDGKGNMVEESDRWEQALLYRNIAEECWEEALEREG